MTHRTFADRLVAARQAAGMNKQKQLVDQLDSTAQSTVSSWENGTTEPSLADIRKIALACRCSADFLLGLTESITSQPLPPGHWVVDLDRVEKIRQKQNVPGGRFAWPIPPRYSVLSPVEFAELDESLFHRRGKK